MRPKGRNYSVVGVCAVAVALLAGCTAAPTGQPPTLSASSRPSPTANAAQHSSSSDSNSLSATGEVPFADGRWRLYVPPSWTASPYERDVVANLGQGVEPVGVWQVTDDPNDVVLVGAFSHGDTTDTQLEQMATVASRGIALLYPDASTTDPQWSTTPSGHRLVMARTTALLEDDSTMIQVCGVVDLGDDAMYVVALSSTFGADGALQTIVNNLEPSEAS